MFDQTHLWIISGPPGAGKSTVSIALASMMERSVVIPVDDIREWVVGGIAHPVPDWTDETARQFELAEDAAADVIRRYLAAGFDVIVDHCRLPENIDRWIERSLGGLNPIRVAVLPPLELTLERNRLRKNKSFDPTVLEPVIRGVDAGYRRSELAGWVVETGTEDARTIATRLLGGLSVERATVCDEAAILNPMSSDALD